MLYSIGIPHVYVSFIAYLQQATTLFHPYFHECAPPVLLIHLNQQEAKLKCQFDLLGSKSNFFFNDERLNSLQFSGKKRTENTPCN